jgi:hypothetical protein
LKAAIAACARSSRPAAAFPTDEAALKLLFLAIRNAGVHCIVGVVIAGLLTRWMYEQEAILDMIVVEERRLS